MSDIQENKDDARGLWEHEDRLINQRITWLGVSQGLLFAAYGVTLKTQGSTLPIIKSKILNLLPLVGLTISLLVLIGTLGAALAMFIIQKTHDKNHNKLRFGISHETTLMGLSPAFGIPLVFSFSWLFLLNNTNVIFPSKSLIWVGLTGLILASHMFFVEKTKVKYFSARQSWYEGSIKVSYAEIAAKAKLKKIRAEVLKGLAKTLIIVFGGGLIVGLILVGTAQ